MLDDTPAHTGEMLRRAREAAGLDLADVSARTRIPERHLRALEEADYTALPHRTYALGFARTYAGVLGLNAEDVIASLRRDYRGAMPEPEPTPPAFTPGDPARVPSARFAFIAGLAVLLLGVGGFAYWQGFGSDVSLPSLLPDNPPPPPPAAKPAAAPAPAPSAQPTGPVVFTAQAKGIWVKFYDGDASHVLLEKQLAEGESFTLPAEAKNPMIWTGRPEALAITIGGQPQPKLADAQKIMRDVPVSATALLARQAAPAAPAQPAMGPTMGPAMAPQPGMAPMPGMMTPSAPTSAAALPAPRPHRPHPHPTASSGDAAAPAAAAPAPVAAPAPAQPSTVSQ
ncbi:MAG TPA: helix-turn-helix domain-containing protein [Novosphingobium sp.]|nr:helix-turn-helix domain-containing protein [Novosphingobium sp.]